MANDYNELKAFVKAHASDPINLAKIINNWEWSSLTAGGYGPPNTDAEHVPETLQASCGWRYILMAALFDEIGIQSRAVNFYNVPFQGNHTAVELLINGKWMWFDPTFGTYFEPRGGGAPLSIAEIRDNWPNVVLKKSTMEGWQGQYQDPDHVSPYAYKTYTDNFFYQPESFSHIPQVLSGEVNSLYFGPNAFYWKDGVKTPIPTDNLSWDVHMDDGRHTWNRYVDTYDANGHLDSRWGLYDTSNPHYAWFVDWDQNNDYSWAKKTTVVGNTHNAVYDYVSFVNDDGSTTFIDYDTLPTKYEWSTKTTYRAASGANDYQIGVLDNGGKWYVDWDDGNHFAWTSYRDAIHADGTLLSTSIVYDDGTTQNIDWELMHVVMGTGGNNSLVGSAGTDLIRGYSGNDVLNGAAGADRMEGGFGNDLYYVDNPNDMTIEAPNTGTDEVRSTINFTLWPNVENLVLLGTAIYGKGNAGDNWIYGNAEANILSGMAGNDHLDGGNGWDLLLGGAGNDTLEGGLGRDKLVGNIGADTFLWRSIAETGTTGSTADYVVDFSAKAGDRLNVALIDANPTVAGNQAFKFIGSHQFDTTGEIRYAHVGAETRLFFNLDHDRTAEGVIRLAGHLTPQADWFVL